MGDEGKQDSGKEEENERERVKKKQKVKRLLTEKKNACGFALGSFSPITFLHLRMFEYAYDYIRIYTNFEVVGSKSMKKKKPTPSSHPPLTNPPPVFIFIFSFRFTSIPRKKKKRVKP